MVFDSVESVADCNATDSVSFAAVDSDINCDNENDDDYGNDVEVISVDVCIAGTGLPECIVAA